MLLSILLGSRVEVFLAVTMALMFFIVSHSPGYDYLPLGKLSMILIDYCFLYNI